MKSLSCNYEDIVDKYYVINHLYDNQGLCEHEMFFKASYYGIIEYYIIDYNTNDINKKILNKNDIKNMLDFILDKVRTNKKIDYVSMIKKKIL
jgi:hypothetical protein